MGPRVESGGNFQENPRLVERVGSVAGATTAGGDFGLGRPVATQMGPRVESGNFQENPRLVERVGSVAGATTAGGDFGLGRRIAASPPPEVAVAGREDTLDGNSPLETSSRSGSIVLPPHMQVRST
eukprot:SAG31_NODE_34_length_31842_cov_31.677850_17_plen_126_part_00